jgi:hypothetical protein
MPLENIVKGREKHLCISDELIRLGVEIDLLDDLGDRISSGVHKEKEKPISSQDVSLAEFLDRAPAIIICLSERIAGARSNLSSMLF